MEASVRMKTSPTLLAMTAHPPWSLGVFEYAGGEYPVGRSMIRDAGLANKNHESVTVGKPKCDGRIYHDLAMPLDCQHQWSEQCEAIHLHSQPLE